VKISLVKMAAPEMENALMMFVYAMKASQGKHVVNQFAKIIAIVMGYALTGNAFA
jgi:hypothetical protein